MSCAGASPSCSQITPDQMLLQQFTRRDLAQADRSDDLDTEETSPVLLHTLTATFNGSTAHFTQVTGDEEVEREEPAATSVCFSWEPVTGALAVFSADGEVRGPLAAIFRDVVLACEGEIQAMPIRQFDLGAFSTPAILKRFEQELVAGVEKISILQLKVARLFTQRTADEAHGRDLVQHLSSSLLIGRDRRDARQIYDVVREDYHLEDLTAFVLSRVKLVFRMAKQPHRKAHNVDVQITTSNGLNDQSKTEADRRCVHDQLVRVGVLHEF